MPIRSKLDDRVKCRVLEFLAKRFDIYQLITLQVEIYSRLNQDKVLEKEIKEEYERALKAIEVYKKDYLMELSLISALNFESVASTIAKDIYNENPENVEIRLKMAFGNCKCKCCGDISVEVRERVKSGKLSKDLFYARDKMLKMIQEDSQDLYN